MTKIIYNEDTGRHITVKVDDNDKVDLYDGFNDFMLEFHISRMDEVIEKLEKIKKVSEEWDDYDDYDNYIECDISSNSIRFENLFNPGEIYSNYLEKPRAYIVIIALEKVQNHFGLSCKSLRKLLQEYKEKRKRK